MRIGTQRAKLLASLFAVFWVVIPFQAQHVSAQRAKEPVAIIDGQAVFEDDLGPFVQSKLYQLRNQEYTLKSSALERLLNQKLLETEAKKKGISPNQLLEQEVDGNVSEPTTEEVEYSYLSRKDKINRPFEEVKALLQQVLKESRIQQARQEFIKRLRSRAAVTILLRPPKVEVAYDLARLRGNPNAPVMIVEFSDFQCLFCRHIQATLKGLLAKYDGKVSLAYRDFPEGDNHAQAKLAAQASRCAAEQRKFWEYHDALFSTTNLDEGNLVELARIAGLDTKHFNACLVSGKYKGAIEIDVQDGSRVGVSGTPMFFINGIPLSGAQPLAMFERIIDEELASAKFKPASD